MLDSILIRRFFIIYLKAAFELHFNLREVKNGLLYLKMKAKIKNCYIHIWLGLYQFLGVWDHKSAQYIGMRITFKEYNATMLSILIQNTRCIQSKQERCCKSKARKKYLLRSILLYRLPFWQRHIVFVVF